DRENDRNENSGQGKPKKRRMRVFHRFAGCERRNSNLVPIGKTSSPKLKPPRFARLVCAPCGWTGLVLIRTVFPWLDTLVSTKVSGLEEVVEREPREA